MNLPYITADATGPKHMNIKVTRAKLESPVEDTVNRSIEPLKVALQDAGLSVSDIRTLSGRWSDPYANGAEESG